MFWILQIIALSMAFHPGFNRTITQRQNTPRQNRQQQSTSLPAPQLPPIQCKTIGDTIQCGHGDDFPIYPVR